MTDPYPRCCGALRLAPCPIPVGSLFQVLVILLDVGSTLTIEPCMDRTTGANNRDNRIGAAGIRRPHRDGEL